MMVDRYDRMPTAELEAEAASRDPAVDLSLAVTNAERRTLLRGADAGATQVLPTATDETVVLEPVEADVADRVDEEETSGAAASPAVLAGSGGPAAPAAPDDHPPHQHAGYPTADDLRTRFENAAS